MNRLSSAVAVTAAAGAILLGGASPAMAAPQHHPEAYIVVSPDTVYQGSSFTVQAGCHKESAVPTLSSPLFGTRTLAAGTISVVHIQVGATVTPQQYDILLSCALPGGKVCGKSHASITVLKWVKPTPPPVPPTPPVPPAPPAPHRHRVVHVLVFTGFGGMASAVASHHPLP